MVAWYPRALAALETDYAVRRTALERAQQKAEELEHLAPQREKEAREAAALAEAQRQAAEGETDATLAAGKLKLSEEAAERAATAKADHEKALAEARAARTQADDLRKALNELGSDLEALRRSQPELGRDSSHSQRTRSSSVTSVVVVLSALVVGYLAILLFYATQLHTRISEMKLNGVPINIWRTGDLKERIDDWNDQLNMQEDKLRELRKNYDNTRRENQVRARIKAEQENKFVDEMNSVSVFTNLVIPVEAKDLQANYYKAVSALSGMKADEKTVSIARDQITTAFEKYVAAVRAVEDGRSREAAFKSEIENAEAIGKGTVVEAARLFGLSATDIQPEFLEQVRNLLFEIESGGLVLSGLKDKSSAESGGKGDRRVQTAATGSTIPASGVEPRDGEAGLFSRAWQALKNASKGLFRNAFLLWPTENLVLLLVIVMGVLGSCLHLMADHFGSPRSGVIAQAYEIGPAQALLRIFYGGVTALVVYLVAKASVPIVTDTSRLGAQAPLNPYFISFVGIMSGLVSERAIRSLRGMGEGIFSTGGAADPTPRYATPLLENKIAVMENGVAALSVYLNLKLQETENIVRGRQPLLAHEQSVIAAFAHVDPREAFSDLPGAR